MQPFDAVVPPGTAMLQASQPNLSQRLGLTGNTAALEVKPPASGETPPTGDVKPPQLPGTQTQSTAPQPTPFSIGAGVLQPLPGLEAPSASAQCTGNV